MPRTITLRGTPVVEWEPAIPRCVRCGSEHWCRWIVYTDEGPVGEPCLTSEEKQLWLRMEEKPVGKIHAPT